MTVIVLTVISLNQNKRLSFYFKSICLSIENFMVFRNSHLDYDDRLNFLFYATDSSIDYFMSTAAVQLFVWTFHATISCVQRD